MDFGHTNSTSSEEDLKLSCEDFAGQILKLKNELQQYVNENEELGDIIIEKDLIIEGLEVKLKVFKDKAARHNDELIEEPDEELVDMTAGAKILADLHKLDVSEIEGSGSNGRIVKSDVELYIEAMKPEVVEEPSNEKTSEDTELFPEVDD